MATIPDGWDSNGDDSAGADEITAAFAAIPMPSGGVGTPPGIEDEQPAPAVATIVAGIEAAASGRKRGLDDAEIEGASKPNKPED